MYWYSFVYFMNSIGIFVNDRNKKYMKYIAIALLVFLSGTRYYMGGNDVYVYEGAYNNVPSVSTVLQYMFTGVGEGVNENYEIGFLFLCAIVKSMGFSYFGFILIWTFLFYALVVKGLEDFVPDWNIFFAFFMYKIMFYNTFISIRQGLTIAIFCYSLKYIRDRKWYIYFPLCFLAFLEHRGAIIMFPLYYIVYMPTSKNFIKWYSLLFLPTWLIRERIDLTNLMRWVTDLIENDKSLTQWSESVEQISLIHTLECYIIVLAVVLLYEKIMDNERYEEVRLVLQLFLILIPMFTLFSNWIVLTREKDYFVIMYGILFGYILDGGTTSLIHNREDGLDGRRRSYAGIQLGKMIAVIAILACYIGMMRYVLVFDGGHLMNYKSFLFQPVSIFS